MAVEQNKFWIAQTVAKPLCNFEGPLKENTASLGLRLLLGLVGLSGCR